MDKAEIEELRAKVGCATLLESEGWQLDLKESTRNAVKYRQGARILIVNHEGRGWFDPLSPAKGDVFSLAIFLGANTFFEARDRVAGVVGYVSAPTVFQRSEKSRSLKSIAARWSYRTRPRPGSAAWTYLINQRCIPTEVIAAAARAGELREGPSGSMWAAHRDPNGKLLGWEERGEAWRGFSTGGAKQLFRFGRLDRARVCVTEAAIDAFSLAALERCRDDTCYVSTGGGWAPATEAVIVTLAEAGRTLVAATDNNRQGDVYADRINAIASSHGCPSERLRPRAEDWNEDLCALRRNTSCETAVVTSV
ncbi:DUF3991 and toprim domain-containing protein [Rhodopseudomonas parapalustris]